MHKMFYLAFSIHLCIFVNGMVIDKIYQIVFYHLICGEIQAGESEVYRAACLQIPPNTVLSSHLDGCKLIDIQYYVMVSVT